MDRSPKTSIVGFVKGQEVEIRRQKKPVKRQKSLLSQTLKDSPDGSSGLSVFASSCKEMGYSDMELTCSSSMELPNEEVPSGGDTCTQPIPIQVTREVIAKLENAANERSRLESQREDLYRAKLFFTQQLPGACQGTC